MVCSFLFERDEGGAEGVIVGAMGGGLAMYAGRWGVTAVLVAVETT